MKRTFKQLSAAMLALVMVVALIPVMAGVAYAADQVAAKIDLGKDNEKYVMEVCQKIGDTEGAEVISNTGTVIYFRIPAGKTVKETCSWLADDVVGATSAGDNDLYNWTVGRKAIVEYSDNDEVREDVNSEDEVTMDLMFYAHFNTCIPELKLTVEVPKCGTEVKNESIPGMGGNEETFIGNPVVKLEDESLATVQATLWSGFTEGTIVGGNSYQPQISLEAKPGYTFKRSETMFFINGEPLGYQNGGSYNTAFTINNRTSYANGSPVFITAVHDLTKVDEVPATLEAEGTKEYYKCSGCEKLFSDAEGTTEVTAEDLVIPKLTPAGVVDSKIAALPEEPTLADAEAVKAAQAAYDALTDEDKAAVANAKDLKVASAVIAKLEAEARAAAAEQAKTDAERAQKDAEDKAEAAKKAQKEAEDKAAEAEKNAFVKLGKAKLKKAKGAKKKITVTWNKVKGAKGYEIIVAKNKKGTKDARTYTVGNKANKVIKKLKKGKYFVKVRAYKTISGNTVYGAYSTAKTVKVK